MPSIDVSATFLLAAAACILAPGPDNLGVLSYGLSRGRRAGMGFAIGCGLGCLTHTLWAVVGISAVIAASQTAFRVLLYAGAAYLVFLGVKAIGGRGSFDGLGVALSSPDIRLRRFATRGFVSNALNPKVALFFLAFLPQFVDSSRAVAPQLGVLGATFSLMTIVMFCGLGYYSGFVGEWLTQRTGFGRWLDRAAGCVFIGLGAQLALFGRKA